MLRNFFSVIRHFKTAFLLNLLGMAVAFTAFMMIMMQVKFDTGFDTCYEDAESIFRLDTYDGDGFQAPAPRPLARMFIASSPDIDSGCITSVSHDMKTWYVGDGDRRTGFYEKSLEVSPGMPEVFRFRMTEGDLHSLEAPGSAVIPESMARRMFGDAPATGNMLMTTTEGNTGRTITGVYRDFPRNASVQNVIYLSMDPEENFDNWQNWNYYCYVRLRDPSVAGDITREFTERYEDMLFGEKKHNPDNLPLELHSLTGLHFRSDIYFDKLPKTSRNTVYLLVSIAVIILLISGINFTNFSTALTPMRIHGINTRKILGSTDASIRGGIVSEGIVASVAAFAISLLLLYAVKGSPAAGLLDSGIDLRGNAGIIAASACIAVLFGVLSGLYPAFYVTSISPAIALKGNFGLSPSGKRIRTILVGVQFTASFILIITASFIYLQNRFMLKAPLGFDKDCIISTDINGNIRKNLDAFSGEIRKIAGVEDIAFTQLNIGVADFYPTWIRSYKDERISFSCIPVSYNFLDVMGIEMSGGRDFREDDLQAEDARYIFNETARKQYGMEAGDRMDNGEITGFISDINFTSMRKSVTPMAFLLYPEKNLSWAVIKVSSGTDLREARQEIEECLDRFDPEFPFEVVFYDTMLEYTYQKERRTGSLITLFSLVAIFITITGVFSLVVFDCQYRRKETAVRKVLGATAGEITRLFCRSYAILLCICFLVGAPTACIITARWLEGFAYRISMQWWVFVAAFAAVSAVTLLTVIWQSGRTANENPVNNLRNE